MKADKQSRLVPKLRFPEFKDASEWRLKPLGDIVEPISERVGTKNCVPMSVTTGVGLISQEEKFGRTIAGNSYKNYIRLQTNDFAYNKSATKDFPQGYIARYTGMEDAAVPNSIFTCFRPDVEAVLPEFLDHLFHGNYHGRWLHKYITVGARAHGALSVSDDALMSMPVPLPPEAETGSEQQKIADCLGSLDDLIAAEGEKLEALRQHKQGLMQQLFPQPGETVPRLRFPEFVDAPEWVEMKLSSLVKLISGVHLAPDMYSTVGEVPYFSGPSDFTNTIERIAKWTSESVNTAKQNDTLITVKGSGVGDIWYLTIPFVALGRQLMAVRPEADDARFIYHFLSTKKAQFEALGSGNLIPGLSRGDILDMVAQFPSRDERQRIADALSSLDDRIAAQACRIEALKTHKQGLLQQLFPSPEGNE